LKITIRDYDIINTINAPDGIEVGSIPKGVGLERMRWDGHQLIDLFTLPQIWVEQKNGAFTLHCIKVPDSQLITMKDQDRKKLWSDNGVYKIKTLAEIKAEKTIWYRKSHYPLISDQMGAIMAYLESKADITAELQELIDKINAVKVEYPK
jgi:hypothetical protein